MKKLPKINIKGKPTYIKFAQDVDFYQLFRQIEYAFENCFIFESLGEEGKFSRYSIIGFDPEQIISARGKELKISKNQDDKKIQVFTVDNPYYALREMMPQEVISGNYCGGLVGYLSYDTVNYFEPSLQVKIHDDFDQFMFGVYTDGLILDKLTNELFYFFYKVDRSDFIKKLLKQKPKKERLEVQFIQDTTTKKEHEKILHRVKEQISSGNTFQCQVTCKTKYHIAGDMLQIYGKIREVNASPFMYYLKFGQNKIIGASPELLFSLRDGQMVTRPLAGTIRRGKDEKEDQLLARQLLNDPKEIAEHAMLVDLHRNDIGKLAQFGTAKVSDLMSVKKFSHVQHISSEIVGLIKNDEDMFSGLAANFPAGTLTGAPKIESMKIIDANEAEARGPYGGAVGHFGFNGDCTFAIAIRTIFVSGENAYVQACGGIVYDSEPDKEYDEVQRKLAAIKEVLGEFGIRNYELGIKENFQFSI